MLISFLSLLPKAMQLCACGNRASFICAAWKHAAWKHHVTCNTVCLAVGCDIHHEWHQRSESFKTSFIQFAYHEKTTCACHGCYCTWHDIHWTSSSATSLMMILVLCTNMLRTVHASSPPWLAEPNESFSGRWHPVQAVLACLSDQWLPLASQQPWLSPTEATHQPTSATQRKKRKRKEKCTLFSDHNGSRLRWQPGAICRTMFAAGRLTSAPSSW